MARLESFVYLLSLYFRTHSETWGICITNLEMDSWWFIPLPIRRHLKTLRTDISPYLMLRWVRRTSLYNLFARWTLYWIHFKWNVFFVLFFGNFGNWQQYRNCGSYRRALHLKHVNQCCSLATNVILIMIE